MAAQAVVTIELSHFSRAFIDAVSELVQTIEHADRALLEDSILEAQERVCDVLRGEHA